MNSRGRRRRTCQQGNDLYMESGHGAKVREIFNYRPVTVPSNGFYSLKFQFSPFMFLAGCYLSPSENSLWGYISTQLLLLRDLIISGSSIIVSYIGHFLIDILIVFRIKRVIHSHDW